MTNQEGLSPRKLERNESRDSANVDMGGFLLQEDIAAKGGMQGTGMRLSVPTAKTERETKPLF
jgi:hypothetical protein